MAQVGTADWQSLLSQSEELISQDFHNYPRINRNIQQLQNYAENFRARTSRLRTIDSQLAATRLLAQQGFDASRLTKDVTSIALQPGVEDVFPADETASVWEYLDQVHKATMLTVVQEAQQDVITSFDHYMEECMERDWAADKKRLFSDFVPHTGLATSQQGSGMLSGVRGNGLAPAVPVSSSDKEKAYNSVVRRLNQALVQGKTFDASKEFLDACKAFEDASKPDTMANLWELLNNILTDVKARRGQLAAPEQYMEAIIAGTRKYLESAHVQHMKAVLQRHPVQAERGTTLDSLAEVQAFIRVRFHSPSRPLDIVTPGGQDTSWLQVYFCLRNGAYDAARQAAARASDNYAPRLGSSGLESMLDEWVRSGCRLSPGLAERVSREGERLLREKAQRSGQLKWPFQVMVHALLSKDNRLVDAILRESSELVKTLEDYMWLKLSVVAADPAATPSSSSMSATTSSVPPYTLHSLHTDVNRWPPGHYTKEGKQPMLYATVLLLSLQFHKAVTYLATHESTGAFRIDAVHLAIALQAEKVLDSMTGEVYVGGSQIGEMLHSYSAKFMRADSTTALQYLMLSAAAHGGSVEVKGRLLQELLLASGDYGSLLGSGGPLGSGGALTEYLPDPVERRSLLEAIAFECTMGAHSEVAVELFMAAGRPAMALQILNQAISARLEAATQPHGATLGTTLEQLVPRARDAADKIGLTSADDFARREVEAFQQLLTIRDLLLASTSGNHAQALQKLSELSFIPLERSRAQACAEAVPRLHPAVADRLQSVLTAAAGSIAARRQAPLAPVERADLKEKLDVLVQYVNFIPALRIPTSVYQKLCEAGSMM